jgi:hypothetical protein
LRRSVCTCRFMGCPRLPALVAVLVDVRRHRFSPWSSSAWAKDADDLRRI